MMDRPGGGAVTVREFDVLVRVRVQAGDEAEARRTVERCVTVGDPHPWWGIEAVIALGDRENGGQSRG